ncbi:MAG: DUF433 domain-containing protein [Caldilineaceae bacterium]
MPRTMTMLQGATIQNPPITVNPEIMSGTPVFSGTRVPIQTLFDYLMDGCTLLEFLDNFPTVSEEAALKVLAYAAQRVATGKVIA